MKRRLLAAGFRQGRVPHRLEFGPADLDLIPYSRTLAPGDALEWPGQDRVMSTLGFEEAFESARLEQVGGLAVPMASLPACVLLKFVGYNDRPAERVRDLIDIVHCFELYAGEPDARRYEIGEPEVDGLPVSYEEAGTSLLGQEVAALARRESLATVRAVLASIDDEYARPIQQILSEERHLFDDGTRRRTFYRALPRVLRQPRRCGQRIEALEGHGAYADDRDRSEGRWAIRQRSSVVSSLREGPCSTIR